MKKKTDNRPTDRATTFTLPAESRGNLLSPPHSQAAEKAKTEGGDARYKKDHGPVVVRLEKGGGRDIYLK